MKAIVFGATSGIAQEVLRIWASRGSDLFLVGRNRERLESVAADLRSRGARAVDLAEADLDDLTLHESLFDRAGSFDAVLVAHGVLGHAGEDADPRRAEQILRTNLNSPVSLLTIAAARAAPGACLAAIGSVAGDRGRAVNAVYGAAKAGLDAFLSALRQRMFRRGVRVVTVKPGFVDTAMTAHLRKSPLFASPQVIAKGIVRAVDSGAPVVYLPRFWRLVMMMVRAIPEPLFRRLQF
jgi:decaprenylphospho-beta-D-erythro-pentofuranosid-2-ulose 2-reductase